MSPERMSSEYLSGFKDQIEFQAGPQELREVDAWCRENIGVKFRDWFMLMNTKWGSGRITGGRLYIKEPKHATLFRMRWLDLLLDN